jgi:hypothetical protein
MLHIKRFIDKMAVVESKMNKDVVLPINDARGLRDDITRLLADLQELNDNSKNKNDDVIQIEIKGGTFK